MFTTWKLKTRVAELEDKIRQLETSQKMLEVEWESVYDNVRRAMAKISKRAEREQQSEPAAGSAENPSEMTNPAATVAGLTLDPMSARIRASRRSG
jgi:phage shock protein A